MGAKMSVLGLKMSFPHIWDLRWYGFPCQEYLFCMQLSKRQVCQKLDFWQHKSNSETTWQLIIFPHYYYNMVSKLHYDPQKMLFWSYFVFPIVSHWNPHFNSNCISWWKADFFGGIISTSIDTKKTFGKVLGWFSQKCIRSIGKLQNSFHFTSLLGNFFSQ